MPEFASVEQIRRRFPALARTHNGHPVAYFDGPGGTQVPRRVIDAMTEYLLQHNANTDWAFPSSQETDQALSRRVERWRTGSEALRTRSCSAPT